MARPHATPKKRRFWCGELHAPRPTRNPHGNGRGTFNSIWLEESCPRRLQGGIKHRSHSYSWRGRLSSLLLLVPLPREDAVRLLQPARLVQLLVRELLRL